MANIEVTLKDGLKIGETVHKVAVLRDGNIGDMLEAEIASERAVLLPNGDYQLISSPSVLAVESLRRQIVKIGDHPGPLTFEQMILLSKVDYAKLSKAADGLEMATVAAVAERGRNTASST